MSEAFDSSVLGLKLPGNEHVQGTGGQPYPLYASIGVWWSHFPSILQSEVSWGGYREQ